MLETAVNRTLARLAVFERLAAGGQGERRTDAHGGLRLGRETNQTLRGSVRAKNRAPLVPQTNARRTVRARDESCRGARLSGDQEIARPRCRPRSDGLGSRRKSMMTAGKPSFLV